MNKRKAVPSTIHLRRAAVFALCLLAVCWITMPGAVSAEYGSPEIRTVRAIGSGTVISSDTAGARERAVQNGLVSAVSQVAWELLPENGMVDYFQELNQTLFGRTSAYIETYRVLAESVTGRIYRVVLEASIPVTVLHKKLADAGFIRSETSLPRLLFLVAEQADPDASPRSWWGAGDANAYTTITEFAMIPVLNENGFTVRGHSNPNLSFQLPPGQPLSDNDAVMIGKNTDAEILITGESRVEMSANVMGTDRRTFSGIITLRAVRADTGEVVARIRQSAMVVDTSSSDAGRRVLTQAGKLAGKAMASRLNSIWRKSSAAYPGQISIVVEGTGNLGDFVAFRKSLKTVNGVKSLFIQEMKSDESVILVDYQGTPEALAESLMLNAYASFGINIYEVGPDTLRIRLVKE